MTARATVLAIVAAAVLGAVATAAIGEARHQRQVADAQAKQDLADQQDAERQKRIRADSVKLEEWGASAARMKHELAVLKRRRVPIDTLVLPDTGTVPVALVRVTQQLWQNQLAIADSSLRAAERVIAAQDTMLRSYDRILVERTNQLIAEHESRLRWEHVAKTKPGPKKLFGVVPLPELSAGVQAGIATTGTPYLGVGVQIGWRIKL